MKLILHIGTEKTGTTAIQKYLRSKANLKELKLWTSRSQGLGNHSYFAAYALDTQSTDVALKMRGLCGDAAKHADFRGMIERSLIRDLEASNHSEFVISSEDLSRVFMPAEMARLGKLLAPHFDEIQIVLFVRRQDEIAISRHGMFIRDGLGQRFSFAQIDDLTRRRIYDYAALYNRWWAQFPEAKFSVIPYGHASRNADRDSIDLFLKAVGRSNEHYATPLRANTSISSARYRFFQLMRNRLKSKVSYEEALPILRALPLEELDNVLPSSAANASEYIDWFSASNHYLASQIGEDSFFSSDTSGYPDKFAWDEFDETILACVSDDVIAQFKGEHASGKLKLSF